MTNDAAKTRDRWAKVAAILDGAFECPAQELDAFLERACGGDSEIRREVETLLGAEMAAPRYLDGNAIQFASPYFVRTDDLAREPLQIGPYRMIREIGRGGMGAVYLAERVDGAFQRTVAIKVIRQDLAGEAAERRFRHERQILARLQDSHIARLYDGGTTPGGVLYFVMEYVEGTSIVEHCTRRRSDLRERLALFAGACRAVQFAHSRYVIHRDLKPSNILVTADGLVKLVDFGIAKFLDDGAGSTREPTTQLAAQTPMTPEYASPEQLRGETITPASDVYSLGIVLHELLTGSRPYSSRGGSIAEFERIVSRYVPVPPSRALIAQSRGAASNGSDAPGTSRLPRRITRALDAVVLRALKKKPTERYPSARELLEDVKRLQAGVAAAVERRSLRAVREVFVVLAHFAPAGIMLAAGWISMSELLTGLAQHLLFWTSFGLVIFAVSRRFDRTAARAIRSLLAAHHHARALVLNVWRTDTTDEGNPVLGLLLQVQPEVGDAFETETSIRIPRADLRRIVPGDMVRVRHKRDGSVVVIPDWEAGHSDRSADAPVTESPRRIA